MSIRLIQYSLLSGMSALLIACGGGGGSAGSVSVPSTPSLSGLAAIGMALANASVTLKDSTGKTETVTTDESGNFSFNNVSSFTPPLMLQVKGSAAGISYVLHSLMTNVPTQGTNTLNVTPATDAITTQTLGSDPANIFADAEKIKQIDPQKLADAKAKLVPLFDPPSAESLQTAANPINTQKLTIDQKTLGTDKLAFDGKNIFISDFFASNTVTHFNYGSNYLSEDTRAFNGVVTPTKIKAICDKNLALLTSEQDIARAC